MSLRNPPNAATIVGSETLQVYQTTFLLAGGPYPLGSYWLANLDNLYTSTWNQADTGSPFVVPFAGVIYSIEYWATRAAPGRIKWTPKLLRGEIGGPTLDTVAIDLPAPTLIPSVPTQTTFRPVSIAVAQGDRLRA